MTGPADSDVHAVAPPAVSLASAERIAREHFGVAGSASELPSERDRNVRLDTADGAVVLKVSNPAEDPAVVDMENAAMRHIAGVDPSLPIPRLLASCAGAATVTVDGDDGRRHLARLVTVLPGDPVEGTAVEPRLAAEIGELTARTAAAMQGFFHPAAGRTHAWDIRAVGSLRPLLDKVADDELRALIDRSLTAIEPTLAGLAGLPAQVAHADVTLTNVLVDADRRVSGVIDFGDMHHTAAVCDLAATLNSVMRSVAGAGLPEVTDVASHLLGGYQRVRPLTVDEGFALADLLRARLCVSLLVSAWRAGEHPDNTAYIVQYDEGSRLLLQLLDAHPDATRLLARLAGVGRGRAPTEASAALRSRRDDLFAGPMSPLMYDEPVELSHGVGGWLVAADGRRYLDAYNNVPVVGHGDAVVAGAVSQQLRRLNVNARYLHRHAVELAERLLATFPAGLGLDTCILVNSGSEAVDLAWRMAVAHTGGDGALIGDHAYHGITAGTVPFSSNEWPADYRPSHVARFEAPYGRPPGVPGRADAVERVERAAHELRARGHRPAMLLADPLFTSSGILDAQPGFTAGLADAAHDAGALVLADEVQSGFGRTGPQLWAFALGGLVPDIVTLGKPMGNGHPVAAVVTRREVAASLGERQEFFSTFAGSPVSAIAALTTLDVIEDRRLPAKAVANGERLRAAARTLAAETGWLGEVRGTGLLAGIDVRTPAGSGWDAHRLAEELRRQGVLVGVTGPGRDVLKVRPPLAWESEHVEVFAHRLGHVLEHAVGSAG